MARIELAPESGDYFDRIFDQLNQHAAVNAPARIEEILQGISVLEPNPLIGRPARDDMRELIIGREARGYVALYRYVPAIDTVFVLAIRGQKEAGYKNY